jgi:hypothetical protein
LEARAEGRVPVSSARILQALAGKRFVESDEASLQAGIALALESAGLPFEREARLSPTDRVDFLVGRTVLEVKIEGGVSAVTRQLHRYAQSEAVDEIVLVTTRLRHASVPRSLNGKPVSIIATMGGVS